MWRIFQHRPRGWVSISEYARRRKRERQRNPQRFEEEQESARLWALRIAARNAAKESQAGSKEEEGVRLEAEQDLTST